MTDGSHHDRMTGIRERLRQRVQEGKNPKIAKWQAALEAVLVKAEDRLIPGDVVAIATLTPEEVERFQRVQLTMDLAPFVWAVFVPASMTERLTPSESDSVERPERCANKILVSRVNDYSHILTAEISSTQPGIDIFDDGSHVGSHNYRSPEECLIDLPKIIWIHFKHRETWTPDDYIRYTESWFYRSAVNKTLDLPINASYSYIHHPLLINATLITAVFKLMKATLLKLFDNPNTVIAMANAASLYQSRIPPITREGLARNDDAEVHALHHYIIDKLFALLKLLKGYDFIHFSSFSRSDRKEFKVLFKRTTDEVVRFILDRTGDLLDGGPPA